MKKLLLIAGLFIAISSEAKAPPVCVTCTSGTPTYQVPVYGEPGVSQASVQATSLKDCQLIIESWGQDPKTCELKSCSNFKCSVLNPPSSNGGGYCTNGGQFGICADSSSCCTGGACDDGSTCSVP